jgi:hypothetical protein
VRTIKYVPDTTTVVDTLNKLGNCTTLIVDHITWSACHSFINLEDTPGKLHSTDVPSLRYCMAVWSLNTNPEMQTLVDVLKSAAEPAERAERSERGNDVLLLPTPTPGTLL